jgi:DtxR family Mn-dependent transcriptional regulator
MFNLWVDMDTKLSAASQDYLKVIHKLAAEHGRAATSQIAESLSIKPASVTGMLQKMAHADPPLVEYKKHQGVVLTATGEEAALEMIRHHRLIELFLHEVLGYPWDEVHEEAERLEHVISEKMERRIAAVLGDPNRDPHGQVIPPRDLKISPTNEVPLSRLRPRQRAIIRHVQDEDPELLRYLAHLGLRPDACLTVLEFVPYDNNLHVKLDGPDAAVVLGPRITDQIYVEVEDEQASR